VRWPLAGLLCTPAKLPRRIFAKLKIASWVFSPERALCRVALKGSSS